MVFQARTTSNSMRVKAKYEKKGFPRWMLVRVGVRMRMNVLVVTVSLATTLEGHNANLRLKIANLRHVV